MTSAELNKRLKSLHAERGQILEQERKTCVFVAATTEDIEKIRPKYDFAATNAALLQKEEEIRKIKHRLNVFNSTYTIEELGMTIDEVLVCLPQISVRVDQLYKMVMHLDRVRCSDRYGSKTNLIEYEYANYDLDEVRIQYEQMRDKLTLMHLVLDRINSTVDIP